MTINIRAELQCNSQSARRAKAGTTSARIGPFVAEGFHRDRRAVRRKLDWYVQSAGGHSSSRAVPQSEARGARSRVAEHTVTGALQAGAQGRLPMEPARPPAVLLPH